MPTKNHTSRPAHVIEAAVKRYFDGESVSVLSKYYEISKPGFYLWINKYKKDALARSLRVNMSADAIKGADLRDLKLQRDAARAENSALKRLCCELMLKTGDYSLLTER